MRLDFREKEIEICMNLLLLKSNYTENMVSIRPEKKRKKKKEKDNGKEKEKIHKQGKDEFTVRDVNFTFTWFNSVFCLEYFCYYLWIGDHK